MNVIKMNTSAKTNFNKIAMRARKNGINGDIMIVSLNDHGRCWILRDGKTSVEAHG